MFHNSESLSKRFTQINFHQTIRWLRSNPLSRNIPSGVHLPSGVPTPVYPRRFKIEGDICDYFKAPDRTKRDLSERTSQSAKEAHHLPRSANTETMCNISGANQTAWINSNLLYSCNFNMVVTCEVFVCIGLAPE